MAWDYPVHVFRYLPLHFRYTTFMDTNLKSIMTSFSELRVDARSATLAIIWWVFFCASFGFFKIMLEGLPRHDDVLNPTL